MNVSPSCTSLHYENVRKSRLKLIIYLGEKPEDFLISYFDQFGLLTDER
jgi:hypothetical protein